LTIYPETPSGAGAFNVHNPHQTTGDIEMKSQIRNAAAAVALLLASTGLAAAAGSGAMAPNNRLSLTSTQEHTILQNINKQSVKKEMAPSGFKAAVGQSVPTSISLHALPSNATSQVPAVKSYDYAMLPNQLLIVNPKDRKIVDIIAL
jgi:hypothetical protein